MRNVIWGIVLILAMVGVAGAITPTNHDYWAPYESALYYNKIPQIFYYPVYVSESAPSQNQLAVNVSAISNNQSSSNATNTVIVGKSSNIPSQKQYFYDLLQNKLLWKDQFNPAISVRTNLIKPGSDGRLTNIQAEVSVTRIFRDGKPVYQVLKMPMAWTIKTVQPVRYETTSLDDAWKKYNELVE